MEKQFVPYELTLKLKELGFNEPCINWYSIKGDDIELSMLGVSNPEVIEAMIKHPLIIGIKAPLWQQAFDWFEKTHRLSGTTQYFLNDYWCYTINDMKNSKKSNALFTEFKTKEEAHSECLKRLIKIAKK